MQSRKGLSRKQFFGAVAAGLSGTASLALLGGLSSVELLSIAWWLMVAGGALALVGSTAVFLLTIRGVVGGALTRNRLVLERRISDLNETSARVLSMSAGSQATLTELRGSVERMHTYLISDVNLDNMLGRLEAAERRIMVALDTSALDHHDSFGAIRDQLANVPRKAQLEASLTKTQRSIRSHVGSTATDTVRQVEALLQLIPRVDTSIRRYPVSSGFAMNPEGLLLLSDLIQHFKPRLIVELGSGASTIWGGTIAQRIGSRYVAIEHDPEYLEKTAHLLSGFPLDGTVECRLAELRDVETPRGTMPWYEPNAFANLAKIDLLIVDGPPQSTGALSRYPALPVLSEHLADSCLIVLDDMHREDEREILRLWLESFPDFQSMESGVGRVGLLRRR